ncbi:DUF5630 domain-containing protein [Legionella rowbothamii]|uniref:DUF5630 domain-containing protein n=1 Tax=Legionella rowbothamii TaxID=96229 RepID=UPI0010556D04|nr:DUF5630 domain-containing protein [Legionella rowbothamii]
MTDVASYVSKLDVLLRNVNSGGNVSDEEKLLKYLNSFTLIDLVNLLAHNEFLREELKHARYELYWEKELSNLPVEARIPSFSFKKQKYVSSLDFLMGYLLANQLIGQDTLPSYATFFELAKKYHSLYALHLGTQILIHSLYQNQNIAPAEDLAQYEELIRDEVRYHGTPGYLLASSFSFHCMCLKINSALAIHDMSERQEILYLKEGHLYKAYFYAIMARLLDSKSENELHNAYFGGSFSDHYPLGADSIEEIEKWFQKRYPMNFTPKAQQELNCFAVEASHKIQNYLDQGLVVGASVSAHSPRSSELNQYGETPILIAARLGNFEELVALVEKHGVEQLKDSDHQGNTAWHFAVLTQHLSLQAYLRQKAPELLSIANKYGYTASSSSSLTQYQFFKSGAPHVEFLTYSPESNGSKVQQSIGI